MDMEKEVAAALKGEDWKVAKTYPPAFPGSRIPTASTEALLNERSKTHGDYTIHADITCTIKEAMHTNVGNWARLTAAQAESLDMIAHKIGRILAGDPDFRDHWQDIAGYATLVAERCSK